MSKSRVVVRAAGVAVVAAIAAWRKAQTEAVAERPESKA